MNRRKFLKVAGGAAAMAAVGRAPAIGAARNERPNILMLMADQMRGDCLGCDGNKAIQTPHLDRLAAEGIQFRKAYSCTPSCTPARAALLTGQGPWRNGMLGYGKVGEKYSSEMPRALREAGYQTLGVGKMHWHPQRNLHGFHQTILDESGRAETPEFRSDYRAWFASAAPTLDCDATGIGWNDYRAKAYALPEQYHPTRWIGDVAVNFLDAYKGADPFFLKVSWERPHSPYDPPERFLKQYADADLPKAQVGDWAGTFARRDGPADSLWQGDLGAQQVRESRAGYYGSISFVDEQVGRIMDTLQKRGLLERTLVVFFSDHGDMTGDHNLWRKSFPYEASARIPMILRWPEGMVSAKRGATCDETTELRDILPTFLDAAGAHSAEPLDGKSLLNLARGEKKEWRPWIDLEHDICYAPWNHWNALTDGKTKYIYHAQDGHEQLFDLKRDPNELHDLAGDRAHSKSLRTWRLRLAEHLAERGDTWVKNGELVPRPKSILYSPNYPGEIPKARESGSVG